ncbi:hypothetical protein PC41400_04335 [Paenibacillus chitinolyticus]|uniref:Uncharacterized protein n=1 Tax=Paenibacillus chitinolyticus TaxID=79263 RepID=A0A410WRJ3_9BACL|nr:hypothetical protein [Paenibacillus chitinolyticus]MCY9592127.1 hypothetical protein [Paenibacillus chitinolyticus]MCY9598485.1 hypothetical protein [Paenibacillus chitinolyticus]QAV16954.1 hypothetical protein PC41400_04335 [Paenibacillus chitinolyticus]
MKKRAQRCPLHAEAQRSPELSAVAWASSPAGADAALKARDANAPGLAQSCPQKGSPRLAGVSLFVRGYTGCAPGEPARAGRADLASARKKTSLTGQTVKEV